MTTARSTFTYFAVGLLINVVLAVLLDRSIPIIVIGTAIGLGLGWTASSSFNSGALTTKQDGEISRKKEPTRFWMNTGLLIGGYLFAISAPWLSQR